MNKYSFIAKTRKPKASAAGHVNAETAFDATAKATRLFEQTFGELPDSVSVHQLAAKKSSKKGAV